MTPTKVQGIWNSRYASQIIRNKLARRFYDDRGAFHQMVSAVDSMKSYFEQLESIVSNPLLRRELRWYEFGARQNAAEASRKAGLVFDALSEKDLVEFSTESLQITHTDEVVYQRAVNYLFDSYKLSLEPHGEWKPVPLEDPQLNILQGIEGLVKRYNEFQQRIRP